MVLPIQVKQWRSAGRRYETAAAQADPANADCPESVNRHTENRQDVERFADRSLNRLKVLDRLHAGCEQTIGSSFFKRDQPFNNLGQRIRVRSKQIVGPGGDDEIGIERVGGLTGSAHPIARFFDGEIQRCVRVMIVGYILNGRTGAADGQGSSEMLLDLAQCFRQTVLGSAVTGMSTARTMRSIAAKRSSWSIEGDESR